MGKKTRRQPGSIGVEPTGWTQTVIICRKCSKKLDGGFGTDGTQSLRGALRDTLRQTGRRGQVGLLEVGCLGVCPRGAVTVVLASKPGEVLIVGRAASTATLLDRGTSAID
jgi:predicted metal-binding protein